jgi:hypothetical protein
VLRQELAEAAAELAEGCRARVTAQAARADAAAASLAGQLQEAQAAWQAVAAGAESKVRGAPVSGGRDKVAHPQ